MTWILLPLAALVFIILGVRVIQGRGLAHSPAQDRKRVEAWTKARATGPVAFGLRSSAPYLLGFYLLGPAIKHWRETGRLGYPVEEIGFYLMAAALSCLVLGFFAWKIVEASAREAAERQARNDADTGEQPNP